MTPHTTALDVWCYMATLISSFLDDDERILAACPQNVQYCERLKGICLNNRVLLRQIEAEMNLCMEPCP